MSYGGTFIVFSLFGFIGLLALGSALLAITSQKSQFTRQLAIATLFLPGVSFWSSAIGKDSLTFMATGLMIWASLDLRRRYPALIIAIAAYFLARPHIAGIVLIALLLALVFASRAGIAAKVVILAMAVPASGAAIVLALQYVGLGEASDVADISEYIEDRQGSNLGGGSSIDIASMAWPVRILSYLFRPLPLESPGVLGLAVGVENLFLVTFFVLSLAGLLRRRSSLDLFSRAFMILFSVATLVLLANTTANLGIAIRQKWMFLPMLICVAFSYRMTIQPGHHIGKVPRA